MSVRLPATRLRTRQTLTLVGIILATALITQVAVPSGVGHGRGAPIAVDVNGLLQGLITALLATALILVFRTNRIINFATIALGVPGAALAFEMIRFTSVPFPVAAVSAVVVSAALGAVVELTFLRRFQARSRLLVTILTIGMTTALTQLIPFFENLPLLPPSDQRPPGELLGFEALRSYLPLAGLHFHVGTFPQSFGFPEVLTVELSLVVIGALVIFLQRSRTGVALRSVAQNTERSALLGINVGGISTLSWVLAASLAGVAALLQGVTVSPGAVLGSGAPVALLAPLTAAVLARFRSIPAALGYSLVLQVLSAALTYGIADSGPVILGGELIILVASLLAQRRVLLRLADTEEGSWKLSAEPSPVPKELRSLGGVRVSRVGGLALLVVGAVVLPFLTSPGTQNAFQQVFIVAIAGLSLVVLTGWAGQVSLGQYAFLGIGAVVAGGASNRAGMPFPVAVLLAVGVSATVAVLVGLPALRVRGFYLGAATFALSAAVATTLFDPTLFGWLLPVEVTRPVLFGVSTGSEEIFYFVCLLALMLTILFVSFLRRSRLGRLFIASRDNATALSSAGVSVLRVRLLAFAVSGALAGFAGALFAFQQRGVQEATFGVAASLTLFFYVVVGGASTVSGALLGVAILEGTTHLPSNPVTNIIVATATVVIIFVFPGGVATSLAKVRNSALRIVAQRRRILVPSLYSDIDAAALSSRLIPLGSALPGAGRATLPAGVDYRTTSRLHGRAGAVNDGDPTTREAGALAAARAGMEQLPDPGYQPDTEVAPTPPAVNPVDERALV